MDLGDRNKKVRRRNSRAIFESRHARRRLIYSHHAVRPQVSPVLTFCSFFYSSPVFSFISSRVYHQRFPVCLSAICSLLSALLFFLVFEVLVEVLGSRSTCVIHSPHPVIRQRFPANKFLFTTRSRWPPRPRTKLFPL